MPIDTELEPAELEQRVRRRHRAHPPCAPERRRRHRVRQPRRRRCRPREPGGRVWHLPDLDADAEGRRRADHHGPRSGRHRGGRRLHRRVTTPRHPSRRSSTRTGHGDRAALARAPHGRRNRWGDAASRARRAPCSRRRQRRGRRHHRRAGRREVDAHRRPRRPAPRAPASGSRCSRSIPRAPSPAARSSATASACRITTPTTACSCARWPPAARWVGSRRAAPHAVRVLDAAGYDVGPRGDRRGRSGRGRDRRYRRHDDRRRHAGLG